MRKNNSNYKAANAQKPAKGYESYKGPKSRGKSKRSDGTRDYNPGRNVPDCSTNPNYIKSAVGTNDIAWYSKNPELLVSAARVPFPYKPGMKVSPGYFYAVPKAGGTAVKVDAGFYMPGLMTIRYAYSIGQSEDVNSPASIAAREMYARVRSKFSGALEADAPDIFMYAMALDMIHAYIAWAKRIYRTLTLYSPDNRDYPYGALIAMGLSNDVIDDLQANKTKLWGQINTLVNMANKFTVPKDMPLYDRHRWMNEHVFLDNPVSFAQSYVFNPIGFYTVQSETETGTTLVHKPLTSIKTVDDIYNYGYELIEALSDWDDAYTINGYLMRAFENSEWYVAALLSEDETLEPQYDEPVLSQIHNVKPVGDLSIESLTISQDPNTNAIIHTPYTASNGAGDNYINTILDLHVVNPSAADVVEATRLSPHVVYDSSNNKNAVHAATEIPVEFYVLNRDGTGAWAKHDISYITTYDVTDTSISNWGVAVDAIMKSSAFNMAPLTWYIGNNANTGAAYLHGDVFNLTTLDDQQVEEIDRVCLYSLFNCFTR